MKWNDLTMKERSDLMSLFLKAGVGSLSDMRHIYDGTQDTEEYSGGTLKESKISPKLSRREIRRDTRYKNILNNLAEGDKYTDLQKKRLSEYYARASGGAAIPGYNTYIETRKGLRGNLDDGKSVYEHLLYSTTPVESIIDSYNERNTTTDEYGNIISTGSINNYDGTLKGEHDNINYDIIDALFSSKVPYNGRLTTTPTLYKNYIESKYKDKKIKSYTFGKSKLNRTVSRRLDSLSSNLEDKNKTIVLGAETDRGLPFLIDNGKKQINYDGAGYLVQFVNDDGKIYQRKSDIYDFEPMSYIKRWGKVPKSLKGLTALDKNSSPVILVNPWEEISPEVLQYYNLDTSNLWNSINKKKEEQSIQRKKGNKAHLISRLSGEITRVFN